ncbi:COG5 family protein [Peristeroidobacter soli]|uniref:hypothetical protein n=1 Tax=Peristeroidobacter soli TaxID=2497877 RepID=UPI00101DB074|nr:hypothetical protein [Peristeroidobacter soli]
MSDDEQLATPEQWAAMTFDPVPIDPGKFGPAWDRARGCVARTAIAVLRLDDRQLTHHFKSHPESLLEAMDTHADLQEELDYLKTHLEALEMAATRVLCVASRLSLGV